MTWVATGISAAGAIYGGISANSAAKAGAAESRFQGFAAQKEAALNSEVALQEASDGMQAARDQADQIKRAAMLQRGQILVAQSASGTVMGEGSAQASIDQLDALSSADALVALYSGVNAAAAKRFESRVGVAAGAQRAKAYGMEAASQEAAGKSALVGGLLSAAGSVAGGYAKNSASKKLTAATKKEG